MTYPAGFRIRLATGSDLPFLTSMLVEAAEWRPGADRDRDRVLSDVKVARYLSAWPRPADLGVVAVGNREPLGAAWLRLFTAAEPAFGFVACQIPELAIGVAQPHRGRGVGRSLLCELLARADEAGHREVSLSVDHDNPARELYDSEGFVTVDTRDTARTMLKRW